jgi:hypothetical protein
MTAVGEVLVASPVLYGLVTKSIRFLHPLFATTTR